jgi:hypothetical protein
VAKVTIDGKEYDTESLSKEAMAQLQALHFVDQELARAAAHTAALQTARNAYARALSEILGHSSSDDEPTLDIPDDISFD